MTVVESTDTITLNHPALLWRLEAKQKSGAIRHLLFRQSPKLGVPDNMSDEKPNNVFGDNLEICSLKPLTGFTRSGQCETGTQDIGSHTVCAQVTQEFLEYSRSRGNDLLTPDCRSVLRGYAQGTAGACARRGHAPPPPVGGGAARRALPCSSRF